MTWNVEEIKTKLSELSSPNPEIEAIIKMMDDGISDLGIIGKKVLADPVLAARILQLANSSFYGFTKEVKDVDMACVILGANTIRNLIYTLVVLSRFNGPRQDTQLDYTQIWRHSLMTACISQELSRRQGIDFLTAFTAGLFNNLGVVLMDYFYGDEITECVKVARQEKKHLVSSERSILGKDHRALSGIVLECWSFPQEIVQVLNAGSEINTPMALAVSLGDVLATSIVGNCIAGVQLHCIAPCKVEASGVDISEVPAMTLNGLKLFKELASEFIPKGKKNGS
ncbi:MULTISPECIES: HDOD domain-containing protein [unclassified Hahella]|uniref:HDOD domain-containing protein n=1 Tax=unclassified Hahella TaxID=2624107 RepID=UPI001C1E9D53|nr:MULTISPECIES: HDOD domain-containing protein [unclassified Hahella]MBU6953289.1 HDOD domain-containing protein [Hahella sp. HN01]MDG9670930.1 HDOD domain-containing protein [Hahella sp. CR1]